MTDGRLEKKILDLQQEVTKLKTEVSALQARDESITVRELMRTLESWISFKVAGSKTAFTTKYHNLSRINTLVDLVVK